MTLDLALIEKLMRMLETSDLQELNVSEGGMQLRLAKKRSGAAADHGADVAVTSPTPETPVEDRSARLRNIASGMAGTFYRAPKPGAEPFVREGSVVREGDQLAIVEAMKMLNPIEADCDGTIVRILMPDGGSVEPGTLLFEIAPA